MFFYLSTHKFQKIVSGNVVIMTPLLPRETFQVQENASAISFMEKGVRDYKIETSCNSKRCLV